MSLLLMLLMLFWIACWFMYFRGPIAAEIGWPLAAMANDPGVRRSRRNVWRAVWSRGPNDSVCNQWRKDKRLGRGRATESESA